MRVAYFHSIGGASGDMTLGALVDAGLPLDTLKQALAKLPVDGYRLSVSQERRGSVAGTRLLVETDEGTAHHKAISGLIALVAQSSLDEVIKERATRVLQRIGEAEARAHRISEGESVLHELGHLDTLIDVVGAVAGLHALDIQEVYASPLLVGSGIVETSHGPIPVPGPATMELIAEARAPVVAPSAHRSTAGELTTPTGAALLTTLASFDAPTMIVERIGYGLGSRDTPTLPNVLAVWLGETEAAPKVGGYQLLETNIDDSTPELLAYAQEQLLALGAADAWFSSIQMKKGRPGVLLSALVPAALEGYAAELILRETSTLGIRVRSVERYEADREVQTVACSVGTVPVKVKRLGSQIIGIAPEYDACRRIAQERAMPLAEVYRLVNDAAWQQIR